MKTTNSSIRIIICIFLFLTQLNCMAQTSLIDSTAFISMPINCEIKHRITGKSYPSDCKIPISELRYLKIKHYDYYGLVQDGEIICNAYIADDLLDIFYELFMSKYQIASVKLIDDYDADDNKSMEANNSSCFNYREKTGSNKLSFHAQGLAIDINPVENPYVKNDVVLPSNGNQYLDRSAHFKHKIDQEDLCYELFKKKNFTWGGEWQSLKDYQHFEKEIESQDSAQIDMEVRGTFSASDKVLKNPNIMQNASSISE